MNISSDNQTFSKIPKIGLGTFQLKNQTEEELRILLSNALQIGYRLFDLAECYKNSKMVCSILSQELPKLNLTRKDIFLTSKIQPKDQGLDKDKAIKACWKIIDDCRICNSDDDDNDDFLDLCLIHWPGTQKVKPQDFKNISNRQETWQVMTCFYFLGYFKNIGVSNFKVRHLNTLHPLIEKERLDQIYHRIGQIRREQENKTFDRVLEVDKIFKNQKQIKPALIQNEHHLFYQDDECIEYCKENDIIYQSYSPFGQAKILGPLEAIVDNNNSNESSEDCPSKAKLREIINKYKNLHQISTAQFLLAYIIKQGILVIPKTSKVHRLKENFNCFIDIEGEVMVFLNEVRHKIPEMNQKTAWDPENII